MLTTLVNCNLAIYGRVLSCREIVIWSILGKVLKRFDNFPNHNTQILEGPRSLVNDISPQCCEYAIQQKKNNCSVCLSFRHLQTVSNSTPQ